MEVYLVGGAVRDELLGRRVTDRDWVVVGATVQDMLDRGFKSVGKDFPVFLHPETGEEYALARTERKIGPGYTGFDFHAAPDVTLEEDLSRRDLTINAIARSPDGTLIDPFDGRVDLAAGRLRHVSDAFEEDPVRILRVARFMARLVDQGFQVCHETMEKMKLMVARGETSALVQERVWQEMHSAFGERRPSAFIQTLRACGALGVLLPEVDALYGVPQPEQHHPEVDTGIHVELCLDVAANLGGSPAVVFAVLMHDLGKGATPESEWPRHIGHENSGLPLVRAVCERLGTPREFKRLAEKVTRHHLNVHQVESLRSKTVLRILEDTDAFRRQASFEALLLACEADARGRAGHESAAYPQRETFMALRNAAASVEAGPLLEQGYAGPELGEAIRGARIKAISAARAQSESRPGPAA